MPSNRRKGIPLSDFRITVVGVNSALLERCADGVQSERSLRKVPIFFVIRSGFNRFGKDYNGSVCEPVPTSPKDPSTR